MKNKLIISFSLLLAASGFSGCRKDMSDQQPKAFEESRKAYVQWFNGTLNSSRNYIYVNGVPQNGAAIALGTVFPSSAFAFTVYSGSTGVTIRDTLSTTTQVAQNFVQNFETGKSYTIYTYDTITAPKRLIVENNFNYPGDNTKARVRFLNLIYNPTPPPAVDVFSVNQNTYLVTGASVAQLNNYFEFPANYTDTWQIRQTGTTTVMATLSISSTSMAPKKFYTVVYRGSHRAAANRGVSLIANN